MADIFGAFAFRVMSGMNNSAPITCNGRGISGSHGRYLSRSRVIVWVAALMIITMGAAGCSSDVAAEGEPSATASSDLSSAEAETVPTQSVARSPDKLPPTQGYSLPGPTSPASPEPVSAPITVPLTTQVEPEPAAGVTPPAEPVAPPEDVPPFSIPLAASHPVRIQIPSIGVDSELLNLGLQNDGTMEVPPDGDMAGWYTGAPTPGELGPAVIVGHVDWAGDLGVFYNLGDLGPGDHITVTRADGSTAEFQVGQVGQFSKNDFPTDAVYGDIDHPGLRVITCGGSFDRGARSYVDNIVVFADLV